MYEMLFHYYPAFVAKVVDESRVQIWLQHPKNDHIKFDLNKTILIDLSKTPSNLSIYWDEIEVDDYEEHEDPKYRGFTSLGPVFPHHYGAAGIYISERYRNLHEPELITALARPDRPTLTEDQKAGSTRSLAGRRYEEWAVVRRRGKTVTRFHGFHRVDTDDRPISSNRKLYLVAHAGTSFVNRNPCSVICREEDITQFTRRWEPIPGADKDFPVTDDEHIYISQSAAMEAGLDIPKKPTGSGEGLTLEAELANTNNDVDPDGPLNVIGKDAYDEVRRIAQRLQRNFIAVGRDDLLCQLPAKNEGPFTSLDLIGHARGRDGLLRMNDLVLGAGALPKIFTTDVITRLVDLKIAEVRLLGCRTASTPAARNALQALRAHLVLNGGDKIGVRGTTGDLFAAHYKPGSGLAETRMLASYEEEVPTMSISKPTMTHPSIKEFPLARDSSSYQQPSYLKKPIYYYWEQAQVEFDTLWDYFSPTGSEGDPFEESFAQVLFVDDDRTDKEHKVVRTFALITTQDAAGKEPELSHIRLDLPDAWVKFPIRDSRESAGVYDLFKGRKSNATRS